MYSDHPLPCKSREQKNFSPAVKKRPRGRPHKENLLEGFVNLDTGEEAEFKPCSSFPSMKAAAYALKIPIAVLQDARMRDCPAFRTGGHVNREQLIIWLKKEGEKPPQQFPENDYMEKETPLEIDETGGVGAVLKSLQAYAQRAKKRLDHEESRTDLHPATKAKNVKEAQDGWLKVAAQLLKYDLSVSLAKRESGELIPIADARKGVEGLLAWHTIATSDALRNVIPECEGKNKYEIAKLLDNALRSSIYRNMKLAIKHNKVPEWMGTCANEFVKGEKPLLEEEQP